MPRQSLSQDAVGLYIPRHGTLCMECHKPFDSFMIDLREANPKDFPVPDAPIAQIRRWQPSVCPHCYTAIVGAWKAPWSAFRDEVLEQIPTSE